MKVFISWSGDRSRRLAEQLREWLPFVLHYVEPWVSKSDIDAGERWATEVGKELDASNFGIICVTSENVGSPWILFESGALSKSMQEGRVVPLLLDLEFKDIGGPLAQFQSKKVDESGVLDLVLAINNLSQTQVPEARLKQLFSKLVPDLISAVSEIPKPDKISKTTRPQHEVLEELVTSVRGLEGRLRDSSDDVLLRRRRFGRHGPDGAFEAMRSMFRDPRDPIRFLVFGSYFRDELPWLYELSMETYRAYTRGSRREAAESERRFVRSLDDVMHGPAGEFLSSKESRYLLVEGREFFRASFLSEEPATLEQEKPLTKS